MARQAPLSMEFSRQEYCSGLPLLSPGYLSNPGIEPGLLHYRQILYCQIHWRRLQISMCLASYYDLPGAPDWARGRQNLRDQRGVLGPWTYPPLFLDALLGGSWRGGFLGSSFRLPGPPNPSSLLANPVIKL